MIKTTRDSAYTSREDRMTDKIAAQTFDVRHVQGVDGPVGLDVRLWLKFATDQGEVHLKLSAADALELKEALSREPAIAVEPRRVVSESSEALMGLAGDLADVSAEHAERIKQLANDLRLAATKMSPDA